MTNIQFWKAESIGNDFVLFEAAALANFDLSELAIQVCNRHFGIGSDGLLVVSQKDRGLSLRMFNPDGTEDFCGNGLRCAAWHGHLQGIVFDKFEIFHGGQWIPVEIEGNSVSILLPPAKFEPAAVPHLSNEPLIDTVIHGVSGTAVSTGSAHFVAIVDELPSDKEFFEIAPQIETDPLFPESISVMFTQPISDSHLRLRIWERGAGETLGCGTGSVAAAVVWARKSGLSGEFQVSNPGGDAWVSMDSWTGSIWSKTNPSRTFSGHIDLTESMVHSPLQHRISLI